MQGGSAAQQERSEPRDMIQVESLTLQYPNGKGIQDVSFRVKEGQVLGYLGPNGAGKTTTIRCLLGYAKADRGSCSICLPH